MSHLHGGKCTGPILKHCSEAALRHSSGGPRHPCGFGHIFGEPEPGDRFRGFGLDTDEERERTRELLGGLAQHIQLRQVTENNAEDWENPDIPAGYTYLAQLMGHDLIHTSLPTTLLEGVGRPVMNSRCSGLELQTIFGGGPAARPTAFAYAGAETRTRLRLDRVRVNGERAPLGPQRDLPRVIEPDELDAAGKVTRRIGCQDTLVADPRNDDNANLAQLCVLFSLFHNSILARLVAPNQRRETGGLGEMARAVTAHAYRKVIRQDLMKRLLHPRVYELYDGGHEFLDANRHPAKMPVEFAHAVSRIGHAMIRPSYLMRQADRVQRPLRRVLDRSPGRQSWTLPLTEDWLVQWRAFFDFEEHGKAINRSARILPHLTPVLSTDEYVDRVDDAEGSAPGLLFRDFSRGAAGGVRSVDSLARLLQDRVGEDVLGDAPMLCDGRLRRREIESWLCNPRSEWLSDRQIECIADDPPLIFYVLLEAAREGNNGSHLGVLGSVIIAEVVFRALSREAGIAGGLAASRAAEVSRAADGVFGDDGVPGAMPDLIRFTERHLAEFSEDPPLV